MTLALLKFNSPFSNFTFDFILSIEILSFTLIFFGLNTNVSFLLKKMWVSLIIFFPDSLFERFNILSQSTKP